MIAALLLAAVTASGATVIPAGGDTRVDLQADGPLLGWAAPRAADGRRTILMLVGPRPADAEAAPSCGVEAAPDPAPAATSRLFRWRPERPDALEPAGDGLPAGGLDALDLDGDGADEVVLFRAGGIDRLVPDEAAGRFRAETLVSDPALLERRDDPRAATREGAQDPTLRANVLGAMTTYGRAAGGAMRAVSEVDIPLALDPQPSRYRVRSRSVQPIGRLADGRMRFATAPEAIGTTRLRVLLLDPDGPPETRLTEAWARYPASERTLESAFGVLDGQPVLIVTTMDADKLSLFGEKHLRVFPIRADRTRVGTAPLLAAETGINLWQSVTARIVDLDADGRDDLVLAYWKGLKDAIAALEVRGRNADGSFKKPKTWDFEVQDGQRGALAFGGDVDGDGRPDLLLRAGNALCVYSGEAPDKALERPVAKVPSRTIPLPDGLPQAGGGSVAFSSQGLTVAIGRSWPGSARLLDLDGDGRDEILFADGIHGSGRIVVVRVHSALRPGAESRKTTPR